MCNAIFYKEDDEYKEINTVWGLKQAGFVVTNQYLESGYINTDLEKVDVNTTSCLCPVDVEKLLTDNGYAWSRDPFGWCLAPLKGAW